MSETPTLGEEAAKEVAKVAKRSVLPKIILIVCALLAIVLGGAVLTARYGVLFPQGRLLVEARANGLKVGRFGRLKIEGLGGDIWRDFSIRRLTVSDEKGIWVEAKNIKMTWSYAALFQRRFQADTIVAEQVTLLRRPTLTPKTVSAGLPISIDIDQLKARVEMTPEFSFRRGVYDVTAQLDVQRRNGGQKGVITAASALHAGDHLNLHFDFGGGRPLLLYADAVEAKGGALAGSLGLPVDQPFDLKVSANGDKGQGRFKAVTRVGDLTPVDAAGSWNAQGGSAKGKLLLTASTHTKGLVERLGPDVGFDITGRKAADNLFDVDAHLASAKLTVIAKGKANLGERRTGPQGVALQLAAKELSKVTGGPSMGLGRADGVLTGTLDDLRFAGTADVARLKLGSYGLDRVSGPFVLTRKDKVLAINGKADGAGGRGSGLAAALLGANPRANFDVARLADGRLMLRDIDAAGAGLKVRASGGRSLLGGLNFKGRADFSNLAAARIGATGAVSAEWSADQGGKGRPWVLSVDATGARFASGFAELDRLLGASPRLQAKAEVAGRRISISRGVLDGAAIKANTAGVLDDGDMRFKLDWSANGPFRAGPVEITGKASGSGAITGTLSAPRADLMADIEAIDLPRIPLKNAKLTLSFMRRADGSSGVFALTGASEYGLAAAKAAFRFPRGGVDLSDLSVNAGGLTAAGSVSLRRSTPSAADLHVRLAQGAFLEGGQVDGVVRIIDAAGGPRAKLDLTAANAVLPGARFAVKTGRITADGPLARLAYQAKLEGASTNGTWSVEGRGLLSQNKPGLELTFDGGGRLGRRKIETTETAIFRLNGDDRAAHLRLAASDGGRIDVDAKLGKSSTDIRAQVAQLGLGLVSPDLTGKADATLTLSGAGGRLDGVLDAKLDDARSRGSPRELGMDGTLKARLAGDEIVLDAAVTNEHGLRANANLTLPAEASADPFRIAINRTRPMKGTFYADGEVRPLWDLLVGGERELAGHVRMQGTLSGTLADPRAVGQAEVDDGHFNDSVTGLALTNVVLRATLANNAVNIVQATGADGHGGSLSGSGRLSLQRDGASTFKLDLKNFRLIDNELATASASGEATLDRTADGKVRLAGDLTIDRADVSAAKFSGGTGVVSMDVIEINKPADISRSLQPVARRGPGIALDVSLKAPRRIYLRGRGLDAELSLDAKVGGTTSKPTLSGTARIVRGEYDFAGKRFEFDERGTVQLATSPQNIRLDLLASRVDPSLTAVVRIRGTAAKPEITLTSVPVLPNDEVLSQVLFGRSASQLSPLEAAQLASALSSMAGGGGFDVIGNLRTFAGLDRLALAGGDESGVTVSGGKYLTEDVYLELTGGGRDGPSAQVEWRFGRNLSIISKLASQGDGQLAVRWRKDY